MRYLANEEKIANFTYADWPAVPSFAVQVRVFGMYCTPSDPILARPSFDKQRLKRKITQALILNYLGQVVWTLCLPNVSQECPTFLVLAILFSIPVSMRERERERKRDRAVIATFFSLHSQSAPAVCLWSCIRRSMLGAYANKPSRHLHNQSLCWDYDAACVASHGLELLDLLWHYLNLSNHLDWNVPATECHSAIALPNEKPISSKILVWYSSRWRQYVVTGEYSHLLW